MGGEIISNVAGNSRAISLVGFDGKVKCVREQWKGHFVDAVVQQEELNSTGIGYDRRWPRWVMFTGGTLLAVILAVGVLATQWLPDQN